MAMQLCPRCGSGAGETATECKVCGSPFGAAVSAQPAAAAPPPTSSFAVTPAADLSEFVIPGGEPEAPYVPSYLRSEPAPASSPAGNAPLSAPSYRPPAPSAAGSGPLNAPSYSPPAPSAAQQQPSNYMAGSAAPAMGGGDVRVSLTGEVMEVQQPTARGTGPGGYGPPPGAGPGGRPGGPGGRQAAPAGPQRAQGAGIAYEKPAKKSNPVGIIMLVIVLIGGGAGGWWWWNQKKQAPVLAADRYVQALKSNDWKATFKMVEFSPDQVKQFENFGGIDSAADKIDSLMKLSGATVTVKDYSAKLLTNDGATATVQLKMTVDASSKGGTTTQTIDQPMPFKLVNGEWKVDASKAGPIGMPGVGGGSGGFGGGSGAPAGDSGGRTGGGRGGGNSRRR